MTRSPSTVRPTTLRIAEARLIAHPFERAFHVWRLFVSGVEVDPRDTPVEQARKINERRDEEVNP